MTEFIHIGDISIAVTRKDIKNVHLSVHPPEGRVTLSAPTETRLEVARAYAVTRLSWIREQQEKLRSQVAQLLTPMFGDGNFTTEIQVELDMNQVTSARESYDKEGAVRTESEQQSQIAGQNQAGGIPGVLSNTPPQAAKAEDGPPQDTQAAAPQAQVNGEKSSTRTYELGREVSVANTAPGDLKRLSVAVALSAKAMKGTKPADIDQIKQLVSAAVGANPERGDQVTVVARKFEPIVDEPVEFYETPWFATLVRYSVALIAVLLVLLLGVRPLIKALKRSAEKSSAPAASAPAIDNGQGVIVEAAPVDNAVNAALLNEKVELAQRMFTEKPDSAVAALRQMLNQPEAEPAQ